MNTLLWIALVLFSLTLFPIFINLNVFFDISQKKGCFSVYLFKIIKIHGGYATLYDKGIAFHLSNEKANLVPYKEFLNTRKKFEITDGFQIYSYNQIIEIGSEDSVALTIMASSLLNVLTNALFSAFNRNKAYLSLKSGVLLTPTKNTLKISIKLVAVFNLFVLAMAGVKIILEKIISYGRKRKKQKS